MVPLALADCQYNIVTLLVALIKALDGDMDKLSNLKLNPKVPFPSEVEKIKNETPTIDEIKKWVKDQ